MAARRSKTTKPGSLRSPTVENTKIICSIADRQQGVVSRRQLLKEGLSASLIQKRTESLRLVTLHSGVYAVGQAPLTLRSRHTAAVLAGGPCAALSHRSAAAHWGIAAPPRRIEILRTSSPDRPNSKLENGPNRYSDRLTIHRSRVFNEAEYEIHNGIRTTTVARTLLDLASVLSLRQLESALTQAEQLGLVKMKELRRVLERGRGWKGIGKLRHLVDTWNPNVLTTKSDMEIAFVRLCQDHKIEMPDLNVRIGNMEVDCLWRSQGLAVELDTPRFHSSPAAFYRDRRKDRKLERLGFRVLRIDDRMLSEEPDETVRAVRSRLQSARSP